MTPKTKTMLLVVGVGAVGVFAIGWILTSGGSSSSSAGPQNAVNPNAQDAPGGPFAAQGTMPDIGNLLSYNQPVGATVLAPQATSVSSGSPGDYSPIAASWGPLGPLGIMPPGSSLRQVGAGSGSLPGSLPMQEQ